METLSTYFVEEAGSMRSGEEEEGEEEEEEGEDEEDKEEEKYDSQTEESAVQKEQRPAWAPCFFFRMDREVLHYAGQEIIIEGALDSYAGMIWPAALFLCHYLDTHREQLSLVDKAVLEIGAGNGIVSIVAALLGAWVTATDFPEVLHNLTVNLSKNTRGRCRHTPQVAALPWGYNLERTHPTSVYRYDYVLAADVVYHHVFLDELLATMKHFCQPGTAVIWANKVRMENDLTFTENFKKAFHTSLLAENGDMKIFMATCREEEGEGDEGLEIQDLLREEEEGIKEEAEDEKKLAGEEHNKDELHCVNKEKEEERKENDNGVTEEPHVLGAEREDDEHDCEEEEEMEETMVLKDDKDKEDEKNKPENDDSNCSSTAGDEDITEQESGKQATAQQDRASAWTPSIISSLGRDVYHYAGQDIVIYESIDSYGAVMWPAALALCSFLDNNRERVNLRGKEVLELGAGTGLVTIVASLLGASVTATDLPEVLSNLRANVMRNTRGRSQHTPQVEVLSWGYNLERTHPTSVYRYDYVLAADVVYHHDFLDELLATMKHFCQPGTAVIWANKVRMENDLTFTENFKKAFHTSLLAEDGDMRIFMATCREEEGEGDEGLEIQDLLREEEEGIKEEAEDEKKLAGEEHNKDELHCVNKEKEEERKENDNGVTEEPHVLGAEREDDEHDCEEEEEMEETMVLKDDEDKEDEKNRPENDDSNCSSTAGDEDITEQESGKQAAAQQDRASAWTPSIISSLGRDVYHYAGQDIVIYESIDSYGAVMWPAALALCSFLDNNRERVNLRGKEVLELGAGTGLVTIVASLLGASVTATDLPEVLSNLRANVMRNTRGRSQHTPQVEVLSWGYNLQRTHPTSVYRYDYVLAADVVYHHDFLDELLATMKHFCQPGTAVIWANKVRMENDLTFTENFKKAFHTSLLAEDGDMRIFMATCRESRGMDGLLNGPTGYKPRGPRGSSWSKASVKSWEVSATYFCT